MILLRAWVGGWENRVLHLNSQSDLGIAASIFCVRRAADA